jgi:hypothetical protein
MARGRARRGPLLIAVVSAVLFGSAGRALARDEPERIRTFYAAPPECPSSDAFADAVQARTRRPWVPAGRSSTRTFRVAITLSDGVFRGRLVTESPSGSTRSDEVVWESCEEVVSALAVRTALAIDGGPPRAMPPSGPPVLLIPADEDRRFLHPPALVRLDAREQPWRFTAGAQITAVGGVAPGVSPAVALFVDLSRIGEGVEAATIRISVMRAQTYVVANQALATLEWVASRLEGCPLHRRFDLFTFAPCLAVDTGVVEWKAGTRSAVRQWLSVDIIGRAQVTLFERLVLEGQITVILPITRDRFGFGDAEVYGATIHEVPVLSAAAGGGVGVRFP